MRAEASDFELLRVLGQVSYATASESERTLTWSGGDDGAAPDAFSVSGASDRSSSDAVMKLYAGKVIGWDLDSRPGERRRSNAVPDVLLKEYVNAAAAKMADAEVEAYMALYSDPSDSTIAQRRDGIPIGEAFDPASLPVVPLVAFFASKPLGGSLDAAGSLWTVQAWGPGGLTRLAEYPARRQPAPEPAAAWWPPVQRVRDVGLGPRHRFVRAAARGIFAAVAAIHARGVAHGAVDASAFQVNTTADAEADDLEVRLMNFGFASPLDEDARRRDVRAAAAAAAETIFSALRMTSGGGKIGGEAAGAGTDAASLARLFERVFDLDPRRAREYFAEDPAFGAVVEFMDYRDRQGDGWATLADAFGGDAAAEEILARMEAVETPYD
jgi:hypothetical protein